MTLYEWFICANVVDAMDRHACARGRGYEVGIVIAAAIYIVILLGWALRKLQQRIRARER